MWEIGKRLRTARGNRTIDDSARRVGISQGYLSNLETGRKTPNWDLLAKLAQLYEVSADEILGLKAPAAPPYVKEIASVLEGTTAGMRDEALAILRLMAERDKQRQADVKYYRWLLTDFWRWMATAHEAEVAAWAAWVEAP